MSTHMPGFQLFFRFLHCFVLVKLVTSSIRVKGGSVELHTYGRENVFDAGRCSMYRTSTLF